MPPSAKRSSQRTRRARDPSPTFVQAEQSSPSRPVKRRRKAQTQPDPPSEPADEEGSSITIHPKTEDGEDAGDLIIKVSQCLASYPTQASKDHANSLQESSTEIEAYAKIAAQDWTYYIRNLVINVGRTSEPVLHAHLTPSDPEDKDFVHIDLGPNKVFSRQTAMIYYDSELEHWYLLVKGRNGLKVNGAVLKRDDEPHQLSSGEVIEAGGLEMMFILPASITPLNIHEMYTSRIGQGPPPPSSSRQRSSPVPETRHALPPPPSGEAANHRSAARALISSFQSQSAQQLIAPAPPDYRRPGTPPSAAKNRTNAAQHKSPAVGSSGTMLMNPNDVDLSLDENKHIKPLFSYAQMITQAIISIQEQKLNLNGIYRYIMDHYAYYRNQTPNGWQNSIRHNLSLNKSFSKAPRSTDEPGKGMKWEIVPEEHEAMIRNAYKIGRGGHRGSSAPSSPNQPSQLNYINKGPREMATRGPGSTRKRKASPVASPPPSSNLNPTQTPDRSSARYHGNGPASFQDGSPLPRPRRSAFAASSSFANSDGLPRSPPTLSSSYLQDEGTSFVTPAPQRLHPRLAPPSTAQRPSQHMPTSSPAPFWKYAEIGSTPLRAVPFDPSPSKPVLPGSSSSPPPVDGSHSPVASPTRSTVRGETQETAIDAEEEEVVEEEEEDDDDAGFDLTKGFQSIGSYHAPISRGLGVPRANGR
ncbi:fork head domain-containing protein [Xylariales sp. AK1849]|nr:fork head domain-containing protein [Xylariales sp. AK1849]